MIIMGPVDISHNHSVTKCTAIMKKDKIQKIYVNVF